MKGLGISTVLLTDELIKKYSEDRIILERGDINLKVEKVIEPVPGGLYDSNYFGSVLLDACNCRRVKKFNVYCHDCGSEALDEETRNSRFARIELPWHYVPHFKKSGVEKFISENFKVKYEFTEIDAVAGRGKLIKGLELGQVRVELTEGKDKPTLILHDQYTDIEKCSYEGLLSGLREKGLGFEADELKRYIDLNVLVLPASMRGVKITTIKGKKVLTLPKTSSIYKSIIMAKEKIASGSNRNLMDEVMVRATLRAYVRKSLMELSEFTKSSKENLGRKMYRARVGNTFRSVITAGPELRIDEVSVPIQNAYAILKDRYIEQLMSETGLPTYKAQRIYDKGTDETLSKFKSWVKETDPKVIMVRQPTLHKYSMMSFRLKIHSGNDVKVPLEVCGPFGGDFDGDQMAVFLVPLEHEKEVFSKMNPVALKFYDKNLRPITVPSHGVIHGYIGCSTVDKSLVGKKKPKVIDELEELEVLYEKEGIELQEPVYLNGVYTTYGRAKMESYIGTTINEALGFPDSEELIPISNNNIEDLMRFISSGKDPAGVVKDIRIFVLDMSTIEGFSALSLDQLYSDVPKEFLDRLSEVREDSSLDGIQKFVRISAINKEINKYVEDNLDQDLKQTMINSNRMKISSLLEMTLPRATVDDDGRLLSNENSLYQSLSEEEYRAHSLQNRMILNLKQQIVPRSGYLNRQMAFLAQGLEFHKELEDKNNTGVLVPHKRAEGRTTLDGKILRKSNSEGLVRVRSIAVSEKKYLCPDHISRVVFPPESTSPAFGLRAASSLTEQMTQKGLSLKHSGSFVQVPEANRLHTIKNVTGDVEVDSENKRILIKSKTSKVLSEFPLPNKFDVLHKEVSGSKSHIGTALATASSGLTLDVIIKVVHASKGGSDEGLAKNTITLANCFAPVDGEIKYDFEKKVFLIGSTMMGPIDPNAVYYFPQGYKVKKFDRVQSNPLNTNWYLNAGFPLDEVYFMFRKELKSLLGDDITEELIEVLFHLLMKKDFKSGKHEYLGVQKGINRGNTSFFAQLSFERGKKAISRLSSGELKFENDIFTRNILDHLIMSSKDKTSSML
jgi:hypothetical protein